MMLYAIDDSLESPHHRNSSDKFHDELTSSINDTWTELGNS